MLVRKLLGELRDGRAAGRELMLGDEDVDAVRLAVDVVVNPRELDLERLRREARATEDTEAAGAADRGDDVAAVAEGEQREVDTDKVADDVHRHSMEPPEAALPIAPMARSSKLYARLAWPTL